nr:cell wall hydrolase [Oricola indica]
MQAAHAPQITAALNLASIASPIKTAKFPDTASRINRAEKTSRPSPAGLQPKGSLTDLAPWNQYFFRPSDPVLRLLENPETPDPQLAVARAFHSPEHDRYDGVPEVLKDLVTNDRADALATAYAPAEPEHYVLSAFDSLFAKTNNNKDRFIPPALEGDHEWIQTPLPAKTFAADEQKCLSDGIYFEARGESPKGQAAVAQVILNRVRNPAFPNTVCGVVYQNAEILNRCQFSFACDGLPEKVADRSAYELAEQVAMAVTAGKIFIADVASATHYFANYVRPRWADAMENVANIGAHRFYRTYGGGWS